MAYATGKFAHLDRHIELFAESLAGWKEDRLRVIASSSFQTQSLPMLHLLSLYGPEVPVYFLDTGYHFAETLEFRNQVAAELNLDVRTLESPIPVVAQKTSSGMLLWTENTERCCHVNKVLPMEPVLAQTDIWITGVRKDQSPERSEFTFSSPGANGVTRILPMLEWTKPDIWGWVVEHDLPRHPLELAGYDSIGCAPCTAKPSFGSERGGRWEGQTRTECGLHTVLARPE